MQAQQHQDAQQQLQMQHAQQQQLLGQQQQQELQLLGQQLAHSDAAQMTYVRPSSPSHTHAHGSCVFTRSCARAHLDPCCASMDFAKACGKL